MRPYDHAQLLQGSIILIEFNLWLMLNILRSSWKQVTGTSQRTYEVMAINHTLEVTVIENVEIYIQNS